MVVEGVEEKLLLRLYFDLVMGKSFFGIVVVAKIGYAGSFCCIFHRPLNELIKQLSSRGQINICEVHFGGGKGKGRGNGENGRRRGIYTKMHK